MTKKEKKGEQYALLIETSDPGESLVIRMKLKAFGIPCARDDVFGSAFGGPEEGQPWHKIFVPQDQLELAREAIKPGILDPSEEELEEKKE